MKFEKESKSFKMMEMKSPGPNKTRRRSMKTIMKLSPNLTSADGGTHSQQKKMQDVKNVNKNCKFKSRSPVKF